MPVYRKEKVNGRVKKSKTIREVVKGIRKHLPRKSVTFEPSEREMDDGSGTNIRKKENEMVGWTGQSSLSSRAPNQVKGVDLLVEDDGAEHRIETVVEHMKSKSADRVMSEADLARNYIAFFDSKARTILSRWASENWMTLQPEDLLETIKLKFKRMGKIKKGKKGAISLERALLDVRFQWDGIEMLPPERFIAEIQDILFTYKKEVDRKSARGQGVLMERFIEEVVRGDLREKEDPVSRVQKYVADQLLETSYSDWDEFLKEFYSEVEDMRELYCRIQNTGMDESICARLQKDKSIATKTLKRGRDGQEKDQSAPKRQRAEGESEEICWGCGGRFHGKSKCKFGDHEDFNNEAREWKESTKGKELALQGFISIPWKMKGLKGKWENRNMKKTEKTEKNSKKTNEKKKHLLSGLESSRDHSALIPVECSALEQDGLVQSLKVLLDTGAIHGNYINAKWAIRAEEAGAKIDATENVEIRSALDNFVSSAGKITLQVKFAGRSVIQMDFHLVENLTVDMIVGLPSIIEFNLWDILVERFANAKTPLSFGRTEGEYAQEMLGATLHCRELLDMGAVDPEEDSTFWKPDILEVMEESKSAGLPTVVGEGEFFDRVRALIAEFADIFQPKVQKEPCKIPPMPIEIKDVKRWQSHQNQLPPRVQSQRKEEALRAIINEMLEQGIIEKSQEAYYSQVHMVPKPGAKWRLCVDYRNLNELIVGMGWPIPNIGQLLQRIGNKSAKWYAVLDLTAGYHQVELEEESKKWAAFRTPFGVYVPKRISMGLKSAPAYFQKEMSGVLGDLLYNGCELYIDDIMGYGKDDEEFLATLRAIFVRLREHRIFLNPQKARIAVRSVEAVGHVIDQYGIRMSEEKIRKVMDCQKPKTIKELRSFLGLANYFRQHIDKYGSAVQPLYNLLKKADEKMLCWTEDAHAAWDRVRSAIAVCPKLYFLEPSAEVFVDTDASDFGIGAHLYQIVKGERQTVAFMSKALAGAQRRWSTFEKECFAIYTALKDWEYLLRDIFFTVRTDHANLKYLNLSASQKVLRWKLALLEYDFQIEHIEGKDNIAADAFSRFEHLKNNGASETRLGESEVEIRETEETDMHQVAAIPTAGPLKPARHHLKDVDDDLAVECIRGVHNMVRGHHGVERTLHILQREGNTWPKMIDHVRQFVKNCPLCQKMSIVKPVVTAIPFTCATYSPMARINMDTIGPLPESTDGKKYILVMMDCFSRFVELFAIRTTSAEECASCLLQFIGRYGAPEQIMSDRGTQFVNAIVANLLKRTGTHHILSIAYSKQENALVERMNREVMRQLRAMVSERKIRNEWSDVLPLVQRILNSSVHSVLGVSPAQLIFGNAINLDRGLIWGGGIVDISTEEKNVRKYLDSLLKQQALLIKIAQDSQEKSDLVQLKRIAKKQNGKEITSYPVNSFVLLTYPLGVNGLNQPPSKLHTRWRGPFRVVSSNGNQYTLENLVSEKLSTHNVTELKPFLWEDGKVDPREVARIDDEEFEIEDIFDHRVIDMEKKRVKFHVRWKNYEEVTWEPYENLKDTQQLHDYLRRSGLEELIPAKYI